jgi:hypothetical protein
VVLGGEAVEMTSLPGTRRATTRSSVWVERAVAVLLGVDGTRGQEMSRTRRLIGCAQAEMAQLVETLRAGVASRAMGDDEHPDRLDVAIGDLRHSSRSATQRRSCRLDGVDRVGLVVGGLTITVTTLASRWWTS